MAVFSSIAATLSAVAGIAGTAVSAIGAYTQYQGAKKAEAIRQKQMDLQAQRDRRASIRQALIARATASSNATAQGAGEGSGLAGGLAGISAQNASNQQGINQSQELGTQMFAANRQISSGQTMQSFGGAIQNFGDWFSSNFEQNRRVATNAIG
jgi:hypothetical protein